MNNDERFMQRALDLAELGRYSVSPNPMVGCVIVHNDEILGEGWHQRAGEAHAEVEALRDCDVDATGATLYVTLEPCSHHGRTPPCVDAVVRAKVARVVVAMIDPHEAVNGAGIARLKAAGIDVTVGVLGDAAAKLNEKFVIASTTKRPFVLLKAGMTLDGKLATIARESQWITSAESRERSLALREEYDAIMVGSGTVKADNPRLTRRLGWSRSITPLTRVVVDAEGDVPSSSNVLSDAGPALLFTSKPERYTGSATLEVIELPASEGRLDLEAVLEQLHARGISSLLVEGGAMLHSDFIRRRLWQKLAIFVAPMVVGGADAPSIFSGEGVSRLTEAYRFRFDRAEAVGTDLLISAYSN